MVQAEERDVLKRPEFQPFIRHDQFGINGKKPQSLVTNILLYASAAILMPLRIFFCFSTFLTFMAIAWVIAQIFPREQQPAMLTPFGRFGSKLLVFFLGFHNIKWVYMGKEGSLSEAADCKEVGCIVSNHASWADILILCSVFFNTYVAKSSIQKLPLFGFLSQIMCVIFVNREVCLFAVYANMSLKAHNMHASSGGTGMVYLMACLRHQTCMKSAWTVN